MYARARALQASAIARYYLADFVTAQAEATEAFILFDDIDDVRGKADTLSTLAEVRLRRGDPIAALELASTSHALAAETDDAATIGWALTALANAYGDLGDRRTSIDLTERGRSMFAAAGHELGEAFLASNLGFHLAHNGRLEDGRALLEEGTETISRLTPSNAPRGHAMLGAVHVLAGDLDVAARSFEAALESARAHGISDVEALALIGLGDTHRAARRLAAARVSYELALDVASATGSSEGELLAQTGLAGVLVASGDADAGEALATTVLAAASAHGARAAQENVHSLLAGEYEAIGALDQALVHHKRLLALRNATELARVHAPDAADDHADAAADNDLAGILARLRAQHEIRPICSYCRAIHDGTAWVALERFMRDHHRVLLSHGICSDCYPAASRAALGDSPS